MEAKGISIQGIYRDILKGPDNRIIFDSGWRSNTIVHGCKVLIAGLMKNDAPKGIQYLVVGKGKDEWDAQWNTPTPPLPGPDVTNLENPYDPKILVGDLDIIYLDDDGNQAAASEVTKSLQIKATLNPGYPAPVPPLKTCPLREFGLYGRFGNSDYMINCVRHQVIHKDESATLIREIKLLF